MADLLIQIVDENNKPVGSATKHQAWSEGLISQIIRVSILDDRGRILVQKRSQQNDVLPGRWDNACAGHVDAGETYEEAAHRELKEELGLTGVVLQKLGDYYVDTSRDKRQMKRFVRSYKLLLNDPLPEFHLPPEEVETTAWMTLSEINELLTNHPEQVTDGLEDVMNRFFS